MIGERRRTLIVRWSESIAAQRCRWAFFIGLLLFQHPCELLFQLQTAFLTLKIVTDGILGLLKLDGIFPQILRHPGSFHQMGRAKV
jgi:hypothetical protein